MTIDGAHHLEFHANRMLPEGGRFLVVGDVHGEFDLLMSLLMIAGFTEDRDWLIFLGDLVDRGPDSAAVLRWVWNQERATCLLGNHEAMMLEAAHSNHADWIWSGNGGYWRRSLTDPELDSLRAIAGTFPLSVRLHLRDGRKIGLVHAEVRPLSSWDDVQTARYATGDGIDDRGKTICSSLLWGRQRYRAHLFESALAAGAKISGERAERLEKAKAPVPGVDQVICGHSILKARVPVIFGSHLMIDTGAYESPEGRLTAVDPLTGAGYQTPPH